MTEFETRMAEWAAFFSLTAGVAATLIGLLFVALALNPAIMAETSKTPGLRIWAGQTFHSFLMVLVIAMIAVIPDDDASSVMWTMLAIGGTGVFGMVQAIRDARADPDPAWQPRRTVVRFLSPLLGYSIALWTGYLAWRNDLDAIGWMVAVVFFLLMSAAGNCWDLLRAMGDPRVTKAVE